MKKANFEFITKSKRPLRGAVTLKNDGKVSISLFNGDAFSFADRYQAKQFGKKIAEMDFNHPSVSNLVEDDKGLVGVLLKETEDLKKEWIIKTKQYAKEYFKHTKKELKKSDEYWHKKFNVKFEYKNYSGSDKKYISALSESYKDGSYYKMTYEKEDLVKLVKKGFDVYEAKEVRDAEMHYANCIIKLSDRLKKKGVNDDANLKITKGWVGVNLEMEFHYNDICVKAWTIIAEGPIQRPHYRYLIK